MSDHGSKKCGGIVVVDDASLAIGAATTNRRGCSPAPATAAPKILQKRWVCDVCKLKWFLSFQEACAHEKNCKGTGSTCAASILPPPSSSLSPPRIACCDVIEIDDQTAALIPTDSNDGAVKEEKRGGVDGQGLASIFRPQRGQSHSSRTSKGKQKKVTKRKDTASIPSSSLLSYAKKEEVSQLEVIPGITHVEYEEHLAAEMEHNRRNTRTSSRFATIDKVMIHSPPFNRSAQLGKRDRRDSLDCAIKKLDVDNESEEECVAVDQVHSYTLKTNVASNKPKGFLSKRQLAEHQAAEFFVKRKKAMAEERERQKKRDELRRVKSKDEKTRHTHKAAGLGSDSETNVRSVLKDDSSIVNKSSRKMGIAYKYEKLTQLTSSVNPSSVGAQGKHNKFWETRVDSYPAVRFPCPSHIVASDDEEDRWRKENSQSLRLLRETPKYQYLAPSLSNLDSSTRNHILQHSPTKFVSVADDEMTKDETFFLLSSVFDLSAKKRDQSRESNNNHTTQPLLWVEKYAMANIPDDVLGASNKEASKKLLSFVEDWKIRRHKSVQDMGRIKSKGKRRAKKKKKKSHGYDSDDSFLDDGEGGLENIFLITGPTGSGKSRIVHAVAEQSDCAVIEINSSEQRSGAALKRAILETTQSHSNLALSKKKRGLSKGVHDFNIVNVDDEVEEDSDRWYESSDEESVKDSHSLTIILIDEVDILFEEDTGFWQALIQVSLKAKCPIVLTSSSLPVEMKNVRYQFISLECPTSHECSMKMAEVAKSEGMHFHRSSVDDIAKRLELIAQINKCDMRKILNSMQLFSYSKSRKRARNATSNTNIYELQPMTQGSSVPTQVEDRPLILSIEPRQVFRDSHTLFTIFGKNFASSSTNLLLGGQVCNHFKVISDNKIIAICPPCIIPEGVSEEAVYEQEFSKHIDCLTCKFVDVVVSKACTNGLFLCSNSLLANTRSLECNRWTLEYDIPLRDTIWNEKLARRDILKGNSDELKSSDDEEFEDNTNSSKINIQNFGGDSKGTKGKPYVHNIDPQALLADATAESAEEVMCCTVTEKLQQNAQTSLQEVNDLAEDLLMLSDAILLEDALIDLAIPCIAGPVEGIGFDTPESLSYNNILPFADPLIDKLSKEKNRKPPSFDAIFSSGVNDYGFFFGNGDAYVTYPSRKRDRQLLCYSELHSRGLGFLDNTSGLTEENVEHSRSYADDECVDSSILHVPTHAKFEDDTFLRLQRPLAYLSPSLLRGQCRDGILNQGLGAMSKCLLQLRRNKVTKDAVHVMHSVVANCDLWYFGLRHDADDSVDHVWRRDSMLDHPLSLDYLPYLRSFAYHEEQMQSKFEVTMQGTDVRIRNGKATRTRRSCVRRNYLDESAGGEDRMIDSKSSTLAKSFMIKG